MPPFDFGAAPQQERGVILDLALRLAVARMKAVLDQRVALFADPLFNPAVCLLACEHSPEEAAALRERLGVLQASALGTAALERFYEDEWVEEAQRGPHWVGLAFEVGEAGGIEYGEAYCAVNLTSHEVVWLDPDAGWQRH